MPYTDEYVDHVFSYHAPQDGQPEVYATIRSHAKAFFKVINQLVPDGADKADALRSLRNCVMTANAGIALDGGPAAFQGVPRQVQAVRAEGAGGGGGSANYQTTTSHGVGGGGGGGRHAAVTKDTGKPIDDLVGDYLKGRGL